MGTARTVSIVLLVGLLTVGLCGSAAAVPPGDIAPLVPPDNTAPGSPPPADAATGEEAFPPEEPPTPAIADPIEPVNRAFFVFNDRLYFWVLKPVARGYGAVVPKEVRIGVRNIFTNIAMPIRFAGNLLQGELKAAGVELGRFVINSTIGMGGFFDTAKADWHLDPVTADLGQTLGVYGLGHGAYLVLPVLGPSSLRDAAGMVGDTVLNPLTYVGDAETRLALFGGKTVNNTSLRIGEYEDLKAAAVDPYVALRDAYVQYRKKQTGR